MLDGLLESLANREIHPLHVYRTGEARYKGRTARLGARKALHAGHVDMQKDYTLADRKKIYT